MATITGLTAARMQEIEDASVVDGAVLLDNLILTKYGGSTIDAGNVRGPKGDKGDPGNATLSQTELDAKADKTDARFPGDEILPLPSGNASTDTAALKSAIASVQTTGVGIVRARYASTSFPYLINEDVSVPDTVGLLGISKASTLFKSTTSTARLTVTGGGPAVGHFSWWGGDYSTPTATVGIKVGLCNQRSFDSIVVQHTLTEGWWLSSTQNSKFTNCVAYHCMVMLGRSPRVRVPIFS